MKSLLVGICGGSCSGKSTLVSELASRLDEVTVLHFDDFFVGKDNLGDREIKSWEDPSLYRIDEYENVLKEIGEGKEVTIAANSRESRKEGITIREIKPRKYVIVEGFLIYHTDEARRCFDRKIFLDITEKEIVERRHERMRLGGGYYPEEYIKGILLEDHRRLVLPQKQYADLIIDSAKQPALMVEEAISFITDRNK